MEKPLMLAIKNSFASLSGGMIDNTLTSMRGSLYSAALNKG